MFICTIRWWITHPIFVFFSLPCLTTSSLCGSHCLFSSPLFRHSVLSVWTKNSCVIGLGGKKDGVGIVWGRNIPWYSIYSTITSPVEIKCVKSKCCCLAPRQPYLSPQRRLQAVTACNCLLWNRSGFSVSTRRDNTHKHDSYVWKLMIMFAFTNGNLYLPSYIFIYVIIRRYLMSLCHHCDIWQGWPVDTRYHWYRLNTPTLDNTVFIGHIGSM